MVHTHATLTDLAIFWEYIYSRSAEMIVDGVNEVVNYQQSAYNLNQQIEHSVVSQFFIYVLFTVHFVPSKHIKGLSHTLQITFAPSPFKSGHSLIYFVSQ